MDIAYLINELGPAIMKLFELDSDAREESFTEFSQEYYEAYYEAFSEKKSVDKRKKLYVFNPSSQNSSDDKEVLVCTEIERTNMIAATEYIESFCEKHNAKSENLNSFEAKLYFMSKRIPSIFSNGTKYSRN